MVAVIKTGHSLIRILNYNENKVKEGVATCIGAANYPLDLGKMSFTQKLNRLVNQAALNENVTRNSVHISLNFDPAEKLLDEKLLSIANDYMDRIGFREQPFLVYRHFDAGHPHIHLVSVKVRGDGSRIDMQNIGRNQSEKARKAIEISYGLKRAEDSRQAQAMASKVVSASRLQYGKTETKRAISSVLDAVIDSYKYASIHELNAVLQQYNVKAERGEKESRTFQSHGLVYRVLDRDGNSIGVPIKASDFYNKPTLQRLESKFAKNESERMLHKSRTKNAIDKAILKHTNLPIDGLMKQLESDGIALVKRQNSEGKIYGLTYVDHTTKTVFNGSDLGKEYSPKGLHERGVQGLMETEKSLTPWHEAKGFDKQQAGWDANEKGLVDTLLQPEHTSAWIPDQLKRKKKKKRKQRGL